MPLTDRRGRRLGLLIAAAGCAGALGASAAEAAVFCSPSGDYCTQAKSTAAGARLSIESFIPFPEVRFCVTPSAGARRCVERTMREVRRGPGILHTAAVRVPSAALRLRGPGRFRATFLAGATRLGPGLTFRVGAPRPAVTGPARVTVGARAAFRLSGFPAGRAVAITLSPTSSGSGNCCGFVVRTRARTNARGAATVRFAWPARYFFCGGQARCSRVAWRPGERARVIVQSSSGLAQKVVRVSVR